MIKQIDLTHTHTHTTHTHTYAHYGTVCIDILTTLWGSQFHSFIAATHWSDTPQPRNALTSVLLWRAAYRFSTHKQLSFGYASENILYIYGKSVSVTVTLMRN